MVNINVTVDSKVHQNARVLALKKKKSLIAFVNEAIREKVARDS